MSVESEILRIQHNIANAYAAVSEKGGEVPLQPNSANLAAAVASIPAGGTDFAPDDTLTLTDGTLSVATPVQGIFTQDEYDALPEAQKNKGLYVIPGEGGGSGGDSSGEIYSTEETRIGTWIDGKPIYRKVFSVSRVNNLAVNIVFNLSDIGASLNNVINLFGTGELSKLGTSTGSPYAYNSVFIEPTSGNVCFLTNYTISGPVYIVIEYTKTTDTAPTQEVSNT